jgi:hypothetical protein
MDIIKAFYAAIGREDYSEARQYLADEGFSFVGWFGTFTSPDDYIAALKRLRGFVTSLDVRKAFVNGDDVALFYDIETVRGDTTLVVVCDTRPFAEVWGRQ